MKEARNIKMHRVGTADSFKRHSGRPDILKTALGKHDVVPTGD